VKASTGKSGDYKYLSFKESFKYFWRNLSVRNRKEILEIPYFDKEVFYEITGIKLQGVK